MIVVILATFTLIVIAASSMLCGLALGGEALSSRCLSLLFVA
jgi:hypothetical protein